MSKKRKRERSRRRRYKANLSSGEPLRLKRWMKTPSSKQIAYGGFLVYALNTIGEWVEIAVKAILG